MDPSASAKLTRQIVLDWMRLIRAEERYYFPKAMELFYRIPLPYQRALIQFIAEKENEVWPSSAAKWLERIDDSTQYPDVIRSILFYYSGRKDAEQPYKEQIALHLVAFVKSPGFKGAEEATSATSFVEELDSL